MRDLSMKNGVLGSITALIGFAGLAWGQFQPPAGPPLQPPAASEAAPGLPSPLSLPPPEEVSRPVSGLPSPTPPGGPGTSGYSNQQVPYPAPTGNQLPQVAGPGAPANEIVPTSACLPSPCPEDQACRPDGPGEAPKEPAHEEEPDCCCHCWVSGEYMLWRIKDGPLAAPLATTSPPGSPGTLGASDTTVILGSNSVNFGNFNGSRWTAGFSGPEESVGLEFSGFFLEKHSKDLFPIFSDATGSPVISRPIIDVTTGQETNFRVSAPGAFSGNLGASLSSRMWGAEAN